MSYRQYIVIFFTVFLFSCGGEGGAVDDGGNANISPVVNPPSEANPNNGLAPDNISKSIFDMSIDVLPAEELGNNFPIIGNKIIQEYGENTIFYLQSDQYGGWKYRGEFAYQRNEDKAEVSLTLDSSNTVYTIHYQFTELRSGTWRGSFNNGLSELSGTFTTKNTPNWNRHDFIGRVVNEQDIYSSITNITYQYKVYLPEGYDESNKNYPVIYVTDAQWPGDEKFAHAVESSGKDIIVVGITEGPQGRRRVDFLWPGSSDYLNFLALEMLPLVESQYRIDSSNRTLYGHSFGGVLIRHALVNEVHTPLFQNFIASDGSFGYENSVYLGLETDVYNSSSLLTKKLYLAGASQAYGPDVRVFNDTIRSYGLSDFTVYYQSFDLSHSQIVLHAMRDSLETLFP